MWPFTKVPKADEVLVLLRRLHDGPLDHKESITLRDYFSNALDEKVALEIARLEKEHPDKYKRLMEIAKPKGIDRRHFLGMATKVACYGALGVIGITGAAGVMTRGFGSLLAQEAKRLPRRYRDALAIFVAPSSLIERAIGEHFSDVYINRVQLAFGFRAKHVQIGFRKDDFLRAIGDDSIQHIAILSHGDNTVVAISGSESITNYDLLADGMEGDRINLEKIRFHQKRGYLLKHTCGERRMDKVLEGDWYPEVSSGEFPTYFRNAAREVSHLERELTALKDPVIRHRHAVETAKYLLHKAEWVQRESGRLREVALDSYHHTVEESRNALGNISADADLEYHRKLVSDLEAEDSRYEQMDKQAEKIGFQISRLRSGAFNLLQLSLFGLGTFPEEHISHYTRISSPIDFVMNPLRGLQLKDAYREGKLS